MNHCAVVDAIGEQEHCLRSLLATSRSRLATSRPAISLTLGCADNDLAALRRQCFYLAITPSARCYSLTLPHFVATASADPLINTQEEGDPSSKVSVRTRGTHLLEASFLGRKHAKKLGRSARVQAINWSLSAVNEEVRIPLTIERLFASEWTEETIERLRLQAKSQSVEVHFSDRNGMFRRLHSRARSSTGSPVEGSPAPVDDT